VAAFDVSDEMIPLAKLTLSSGDMIPSLRAIFSSVRFIATRIKE
jgi:hypothetical protein